MRWRHALDVIGVPPASIYPVRWVDQPPHSRTVVHASPATPWPGQWESWQYRPLDPSSRSFAAWCCQSAASPASPGWARLATAAPAGTVAPPLWGPTDHVPE